MKLNLKPLLKKLIPAVKVAWQAFKDELKKEAYEAGEKKLHDIGDKIKEKLKQ